MRGFSLPEVLIALAIVGILVSLTLPGYQAQRLRGVQAQAMTTLQQLAHRQSRLRLSRGTYETASGLLALGDMPRAVANHYRLAVEVGEQGNQYILRLVPRTVRDGDPALSLDNLGRRHPSELWY